MTPQLLFAALAVVSIMVGIPLAGRRIPPNRWYGLRVPATFADPWVWYEANALIGRDLMLLGALMLVLAFALPRVASLSPARYTAVCGTIFVAGSVALAIRSWRRANRLLAERRLHPPRGEGP